MKIKYLGPQGKIIVAPYGKHLQNEIKEYPADVGLKLLSSKRQQFEEIKPKIEEVKPQKPITKKIKKRGGQKK